MERLSELKTWLPGGRPPLDQPYRGTGADRPTTIPLPPGPMPLFYGGRLRKEWRYVSIWSEPLLICAGSVAVGPVRQEFWAVWDRAARRLWERTRLRAARVQMLPGRVLVQDGEVRIDVALEEDGGFEVVTPTGSAYTWTRKQVVRAHGTARMGGVEHPVEAMALIDDNAGYHPRQTRWQWSGGAGTDEAGRPVAWSVIVGLNDSPHNSERTLWLDGVPHEVGPVRFTDDLSSLSFAEGGELRFAEEATRRRHENLLLVRSAYAQPFGTFTGTLPNGLQLREGYGVMEWHEALW